MVRRFVVTDHDSEGASRLLREILWPHRVAVLFAIVLSLIGALGNLVQPLIVGRIVETVPDGQLWHLVMMLLGVALVSLVCRGVQHYLLARSAESAIYRLRVRLGRKLVGLPLRVLDKERPGDLVSRLTSDTTLVRSAFTGGFADVFGGLLLVVGAGAAMAFLDPVLLLVVSVVCGSAAILVCLASARIQRLTVLGQTAVGSIGSFVHQALVSIRLIKSSRSEWTIRDQLEHEAARARESGKKSARIQSVLWPVSDLAIQLAFLAVLGVGGVRVANDYMSVSELVTFVMFLFVMSSPVTRIFMAVVTLRNAVGSLRRIQEVFQWEDEDRSSWGVIASEREKKVAGVLERPRQLTFQSVTFSYDTGANALVDVSFVARRNQITALMGPSGSGKTTVLSLIEGFYALESGEIAVDNVPITGVPMGHWRRAICYVDQESLVVGGSVRDNLLLGSKSLSDEECYDALQRVNLHNRFKGQGGLEAALGSSGVNLSGGERQRLALARAFLTRAPVVLLDEPTSGVDSENEELIRKSIAELASNRIVIMVAHRLSTVKAADKIVLLEAGKVSGIGGHRALLASSSAYRKLVLAQVEL